MLCQLNTGGLIKVRLDMLSNRPHGAAYYSLQGTKGCYEGARASATSPSCGSRGDEPAPRRGRRGGGGPPGPRRARPRVGLPVGPRGAPATDVARPVRRGAARRARRGDYFVVRDFIAAVRSGQAPPIDVYRALDYTVPGLISEQSIAPAGRPCRYRTSGGSWTAWRRRRERPRPPGPGPARGAPEPPAPAAAHVAPPSGRPARPARAGRVPRCAPSPGRERAWGEIMETGRNRAGVDGREGPRAPRLPAPVRGAASSSPPVTRRASGRWPPPAPGGARRRQGETGNVHMVCAIPSHRGRGWAGW